MECNIGRLGHGWNSSGVLGLAQRWLRWLLVMGLVDGVGCGAPFRVSFSSACHLSFGGGRARPVIVCFLLPTHF